MILGGIKSIIKLIFALPILIIAAYLAKNYSCSSISLMPEIIRLENIEIGEITEDSIKVKLVAVIQNNNPFNLNIAKFNMVINSDTVQVGNAVSLNDATLFGDSSTIIPLNISLNTNRLLTSISSGSDSIQLILKGNVKVKTEIKNFEKIIEYPITINIRELIEKSISESADSNEFISIVDAELIDITPISSKLSIKFVINNPYDIELFISDYSATVKVNGNESGVGNLTEKIFVGKKKNGVVGKMLFNLNNFKSATSLLNALLNRKIEYETNGNLNLQICKNEFSVPFSFKGDLLQK
jgi:LEA14-like dessication related protein